MQLRLKAGDIAASDLARISVDALRAQIESLVGSVSRVLTGTAVFKESGALRAGLDRLRRDGTPGPIHDLPAGGKRLVQAADGVGSTARFWAGTTAGVAFDVR